MKKMPKYKVGDFVRIASKNVPFRKGYLQQFTNEFFQFPQCFPLTHPLTFCAMKKNQETQDKFYEAENIKILK